LALSKVTSDVWEVGMRLEKERTLHV